MNKKITTENIEEWEADMLIEALGNCIELNNDFINRYCSEEFKILMLDIPEHDREHVLSGLDETHWFNGSPTGNDSQDIWLDVGEIEYQFEGKPEDVFENPDDFTIHGDLAYLYVGYGLSIEFDRSQLLDAIETYKKDFA